MQTMTKINNNEKASQITMTDLDSVGTYAIATKLNQFIANVFAIYMKTKNFHWHISGPHFRSYHLLLDEQSAELLAIVDLAAERIRKMNQITLRSIGDISRRQTIADNEAEGLSAKEMLEILVEDNKALARELRELHLLTDEHQDYATSNLLDDWIDQAEQRAWFLFESIQS